MYMFKDPGATPPALLVNLEHQKVLHERVLVVSVEVSEDATVDHDEDRVVVTEIGNGISQVVITHGFMEPSNVVAALESQELPGGTFDVTTSTFFLGDELVIAGEIEGMHPWRESSSCCSTGVPTARPGSSTCPPIVSSRSAPRRDLGRRPHSSCEEPSTRTGTDVTTVLGR